MQPPTPAAPPPAKLTTGPFSSRLHGWAKNVLYAMAQVPGLLAWTSSHNQPTAESIHARAGGIIGVILCGVAWIALKVIALAAEQIEKKRTP